MTHRPGAMSRQLVLLLHAHLPDCRRPEHPASLEETWFHEALVECYIPLIGVFDRLARDAVPFRLTLSVSPTLICMLQDLNLIGRFRRRIQATAQLAADDGRSAETPAHRAIANWYARFFNDSLAFFDDRCGRDVLRVWREFEADGRLELATTAATHAFLPAHQAHPEIIRAQIGVGLDTFENAFGHRPTFFWLPECAYFPGLDETLAKFGVKAFALESHGILKSQPPGPSVHVPIRCPSGVRAVGRSPELSRPVWSARQGYPGDFSYREFHRDRVHDLDESEIIRWLGGSGARLPSGLKYWRVTGPHDRKAWYDPETAAGRARDHARDFVGRLDGQGAAGGILFVPFDAELFGHWWFEGPQWLEQVFRLLAEDDYGTHNMNTVTPAVMSCDAPHDARPAASSWGEAGDYSFWINHETAWIYPHLIDAVTRLGRLLAKHGAPPPASLEERALKQAARTLLLAESSDWPFLVRAGTASDAGTARLEGLLARFTDLCTSLEHDAIDENVLAACEHTDAAFPDLDLDYFRP